MRNIRVPEENITGAYFLNKQKVAGNLENANS